MKVKKGTKRYQKVLDRKCGGEWTNNTSGLDFNCRHDYTWACDECPINTDAIDEFANAVKETLV
jgi:hypothetical protein